MLFRPELALACAIIERAMMDYQLLVDAGIVLHGSQVCKIQHKQIMGLGGLRNKDVKILLDFFHKGDFDSLFMSIYGMNPSEAKKQILSYGT